MSSSPINLINLRVVPQHHAHGSMHSMFGHAVRCCPLLSEIPFFRLWPFQTQTHLMHHLPPSRFLPMFKHLNNNSIPHWRGYTNTSMHVCSNFLNGILILILCLKCCIRPPSAVNSSAPLEPRTALSARTVNKRLHTHAHQLSLANM